VPPGCQISVRPSSCSGVPDPVFIKSALGHVMQNSCFLHPVGSTGHVVHSSASGAQNVIALFFMLRWDHYEFDKKHSGACYAEHVFFNPVESVGHVVHSGASGARYINTIFFMLLWARCGFHKKCVGTRFAKLVFCIRYDLWITWSIPVGPGHEMSTHYFSCSGGLGAVSIKTELGHVTPNLCVCIRWDLQVTWCILMCLGHRMLTHHFSSLGGP
jgi:hypothetical protein